MTDAKVTLIKVFWKLPPHPDQQGKGGFCQDQRTGRTLVPQIPGASLASPAPVYLSTKILPRLGLFPGVLKQGEASSHPPWKMHPRHTTCQIPQSTQNPFLLPSLHGAWWAFAATLAPQPSGQQAPRAPPAP